MVEPPSGAPRVGTAPEDRLDSWKEIAAYLKRDVTTVQRWEKREGMPVHRHVHDKLGSVYAFRIELDAWARSRNLRLEDSATEPPLDRPAPPAAVSTRRRDSRRRHRALIISKAQSIDARLAVDGRRTPSGAGCGLVAPRENGLLLAATRSTTQQFQNVTDFDGHRAGRRALPRRQVRGVSVRSRRTDGRLGHPGRHRTVL